jgi:25S rRNA (adenine2142-N1)-methyltransferase
VPLRLPWPEDCIIIYSSFNEYFHALVRRHGAPAPPPPPQSVTLHETVLERPSQYFSVRELMTSLKSNCRRPLRHSPPPLLRLDMAKKRSGNAGPPRPLVPSAMKSLKRARHVTSEFHRIQRELDLVTGGGSDGNKHKSGPHAAGKSSKKELERQLKGLGGRQAYQEASVLTTGRHRTCKWVFAVLTRLGMRPKKSEPKLRLLEVGAVNTQLLAVPWLAVRAVDIKSQHPKIETMDFFDITPAQEYKVVVCSMVLNCVSSALKRGRMLALARSHLAPGGLFFLMLPRRTIENSPFSTQSILTKQLATIGMEVVETKMSPKVAFFCFKKVEERACDFGEAAKKYPDPPRAKVRQSDVALNDWFAVSFCEETFKGL